MKTKKNYLIVDYTVEANLRRLSSSYQYYNEPENVIDNLEIYSTAKPQTGFMAYQERKDLIIAEMKLVANRFGAVVSFETNYVKIEENIKIFDLDKMGEGLALKGVKKLQLDIGFLEELLKLVASEENVIFGGWSKVVFAETILRHKQSGKMFYPVLVWDFVEDWAWTVLEIS